jgi:predicted ATPase/class 3 adenylate cyclase
VPGPSAIRTFVLTDVEGSTPLWDRDPVAMAEATARHDAIVAMVVAEHGGVLVKSKGEGDSTFSVFEDAAAGLAAAVAMQLAIGAEPWRTPSPLRVRAAVHTGEAEQRDGDWYGATVIRTARLRGIGSGGQVLVSSATAEAVAGALPSGCQLQDLGTVTLRGLSDPLGVFAVAHERLRAVSATSTEAASRLPAPPRVLIGRDDDRRALVDAVRADRLVTLLGPGGVGKTALALAAAADLEGEFADGAAFVDGQGLTNADQLPSALASAIGAPGERWLIDHLAGKHVLLVLDNLEHLTGVAERVRDIVENTGTDVRVLVTTRLRLALPAERLFSVAPLDPERHGTDLLLTLVRMHRPSFETTEESLGTARRIVHAVDGLPLAIELAAGAARALSLVDVERRLTRHASLTATIEWSWNLLDPLPRLLLSRMALVPGGAPLDGLVAAAAGVADEDAIVDGSTSLVDHSLAFVDDRGDGTRYRLLDTVRRFGLDQLTKEGAAAEREARLGQVEWAQGIAAREERSEEEWAARRLR